MDIADSTECTAPGAGPKGAVGEIAPWYFGNGHCSGGGDPLWSFGFAAIWDAHYRFYGDEEVLQTYYKPVRAYLEYMRQYLAPNGLLTVASYPVTRYGDWVAVNGSATSTIMSSFYFIRLVEIVAKNAQVLGLSSDANE
jgi:hypothetical protein